MSADAPDYTDYLVRKGGASRFRGRLRARPRIYGFWIPLLHRPAELIAQRASSARPSESGAALGDISDLNFYNNYLNLL